MRGTLAALLAATGLVVACTPTPTVTPPTPDPVVEELTDYLDQAVSTERFRGAVEVRRDGKVLLRRGYGRANPDTGTPNGPNTRFRIASVTKQFTGLAILVLQERGKLGVVDRVCAYLPNCPPAWADITIEQLLTHTSGIHNYTDDVDFVTALGTQHPAPEQLVQVFANRPLHFTPGQRWAYSNSGYVLLGHLIELISGKTYGEFLHDEILDPLGMSNSGYQPGLAPGEEYAVGHTDWDTPAEVVDDSMWYAAGGMYSTVTDLGRWQRFLLTGDPVVVTKDTLADLLRPRVASNPTTWYGYGIDSRGASMTDLDAYAHSGGIPGFNSYVEIRPASGISVTVLANINLNIEDFSRTLAELIPDQS
jgi:CubicO group peptidase (beta-lactamase class C family)